MTSLTPALAAPARPLWNSDEIYTDYLSMKVLGAMLDFPAVLDVVSRLGPELFDSEPYRVAAAAIATGRERATATWLTRQERDLLVLIWHDLGDAARYATTEAEGMHLVRLLAERSHLGLLISTMEWTITRVRDGQPLWWVRKTVNHVLDIAEGITPLDPSDPWGVSQ